MRKVQCCECERKREPHRPIARLLDGTVTFVCRQCWQALYWYEGADGTAHCYLWVPMLESDRELLRRFHG